jgi:hypothetical protein
MAALILATREKLVVVVVEVRAGGSKAVRVGGHSRGMCVLVVGVGLGRQGAGARTQ